MSTDKAKEQIERVANFHEGDKVSMPIIDYKNKLANAFIAGDTNGYARALKDVFTRARDKATRGKSLNIKAEWIPLYLLEEIIDQLRGEP